MEFPGNASRNAAEPGTGEPAAALHSGGGAAAATDGGTAASCEWSCYENYPLLPANVGLTGQWRWRRSDVN